MARLDRTAPSGGAHLGHISATSRLCLGVYLAAERERVGILGLRARHHVAAGLRVLVQPLQLDRLILW